MLKNNIHLLIVASVLWFSACTRSLTFQALSPAEITLPSNVKKIALVNRAVPSQENRNVLEGLVTGEMPGQDKQGRQAVLMTLLGSLQNSPAFTSNLAQEELKGSKSGSEFPIALSASEIANLCNKYGSDALVVLEHYDSDCIPGAANVKKEKVTNKDGSTTEKTFYEVVQVGNVKAGFRIYDKSGKIIDEFEIKRNMSWTTRGDSPLQAVASTIARVDYMNNLSKNIGAQYSSHIAPYWTTLARNYYRKGKNPLLKIGSRYAATNDWNNAQKSFLDVINQEGGLGKDAARAYYNLGLCYEMKGDLYKAKDAVSKAYAIGGKAMALNYANILTNRINTEQLLEQQLRK